MRNALRRLVQLYPRPFREQFGAEILEQLEQDHDRARARGALATLTFAIATSLDLVRSALAEHWNPAWPGPQLQPTERRRMESKFADWSRDLRHAARGLRRSPGFLIVTVVTLGLAIGANAGMFSVVNTVLLNPLPFAHVDRLVHIAATAPGSDFPAEFGVSAEFYLQYREQSRLLEDVSTYNSFTATLRTGDRVERVRMSSPTYTLFSTLGARTALGRLPIAADEERVAVISYALWTTWFGGDSSVIGRSLDILGTGETKRRTVIGVMAPDFAFPNDGTLLWIPDVIRPDQVVPGRFGTALVGRMKTGATPDAVAKELTALAKRLPERFGGSTNYAHLMSQHRAVVIPLKEKLLGSVSSPLWILLGAVGIVLLIACANVANLFLVRAEGRQRELAVRRAIGAPRTQLVRLQMAEALLVAAGGAALALVLAAMSLPAFLRAAPAGIPRLEDVHLTPATLLFTLTVALLSALACGIFPAVRASAADLTRLREGGRGSTRRQRWTRDGLVACQTALALVLLIGSGLLMRSFEKLRHVDPGYSTEDIFTFQIAPDGADLRDGPSFARFDLNFMERLRALPGVESVGLVENVPLNEKVGFAHWRTERMAGDANAGTGVGYTYTAGDYFKAMSIKVLRGRTFENADHLTTLGNILVSRSAATLLWPGEDPIGRRLQGTSSTNWQTVVGVVDDVLQDGFRDAPKPLIYFPLVGPTPTSWWVSSPAYVVKTARAETIAPEVRALVRDVAPTAPMYRVFTMSGLAADSMMQLSFTMLTLAIASTLALILGAVGLYGVLSYIVAERTREIGVRMALGARADQVRRMVVAHGAMVVAVGVIIGVTVAMASTRALNSLLFGVAAVDVPTFVGMSASMIVVGLLASYIPARRASNVDPIESLRGD